MNIAQAISDDNLLKPFLGDLSTWRPWVSCLRAVYGLPIKSAKGRQVIRTVTGRDPDKLNPAGYSQALFLTGRRSGKSRIAAVLGSYEAALSGREARLAKGEIGMVAIISPTKHQSNIVKTYTRAIFDAPLLRQEIVRETRDGFELRNGVVIGILAGDFKTVRGFSTLAVILDELCFFGVDSESGKYVLNDTALVNAIRPGLATTGGKILGISSVYAKRGFAYKQWQRNFGNDAAQDTLIVHAASKTLNPTLDQRIIDAAIQEDYSHGNAEFYSIWRDDVGLFIPREVIEKLVAPGRLELMPRERTQYAAFVDVSGGRGDDAALAIAHREGPVVVLDFLKRWKSPFDPQFVVESMVRELRRYHLSRVVGDNYAAEFTAQAFTSRGVRYVKSEKNKSELYLELLPKLCSNAVELLDDEAMISQLAGLERRTRSGGRDSIDHPPGGKDDLANAVAGAVEVAITKRTVVGAFGST